MIFAFLSVFSFSHQVSLGFDLNTANGRKSTLIPLTLYTPSIRTKFERNVLFSLFRSSMRSILSIGGTSGAQKTPFGIIKKIKITIGG